MSTQSKTTTITIEKSLVKDAMEHAMTLPDAKAAVIFLAGALGLLAGEITADDMAWVKQMLGVTNVG